MDRSSRPAVKTEKAKGGEGGDVNYMYVVDPGNVDPNNIVLGVSERNSEGAAAIMRELKQEGLVGLSCHGADLDLFGVASVGGITDSWKPINGEEEEEMIERVEGRMHEKLGPIPEGVPEATFKHCPMGTKDVAEVAASQFTCCTHPAGRCKDKTPTEKDHLSKIVSFLV